MARYIDAETALKIIDSYAKTVSEDGKMVAEAIRDIVEIITPTDDVAPRAEVEKIIEEVKKKAEAFFWHQDSVATSCFIEFCDDLKKKYTEGGK